MPVEGGSGKGDLVIRFATRFPQTLTPKQKAELKKALAEPKRQPMPEVVKRFFDGTPMTPEKQSKIFSLYAEVCTPSCKWAHIAPDPGASSTRKDPNQRGSNQKRDLDAPAS